MLRRLSTLALAASFIMLKAGFAQDRPSIAPADASNPLKELISGYYFETLQIRALQDDDFDNPGFRWIDEGEGLWQAPDGLERKACASCHDAQPVDGAGAAYPKFSKTAGKVIGLEERINACRQDNMGAQPWAHGAKELTAMAVYVRSQARGLPVSADVSGPSLPAFQAGRREYETKIGQLDMSCADCHNLSYGKKLRAETVGQGHSNGFPSYSVRKKTAVSLHEQFQSCNALVRAAPRDLGSDEYLALELYLAWRGAGLPVETPAVRR